jgi:hypothetical protein
MDFHNFSNLRVDNAVRYAHLFFFSLLLAINVGTDSFVLGYTLASSLNG